MLKKKNPKKQHRLKTLKKLLDYKIKIKNNTTIFKVIQFMNWFKKIDKKKTKIL